MWGLVLKNVEMQRNSGKLLRNPGNYKEIGEKRKEMMKIIIN